MLIMAENMYFECRKRAAVHNDKLRSRAGAAELLGVSESTLAHYELGVVKNVPVDVVVMMAELYRAPELKRYYCKRECPVGRDFPMAEQAGSVEGAVVRLLSSMDKETMRQVLNTFLKVAKDGRIDEGERGELNWACSVLDEVILAASQLNILKERENMEKGAGGG